MKKYKINLISKGKLKSIKVVSVDSIIVKKSAKLIKDGDKHKKSLLKLKETYKFYKKKLKLLLILLIICKEILLTLWILIKLKMKINPKLLNKYS